MIASKNSVISAIVLCGPLTFSACSDTVPHVRPLLGHSGLAINDTSLSPYEQGKVDFAAGRYGLAVNHFQLAVAQAPDSVEALNNLAAAYDMIGRFDLSEQLYRRALALDPGSVQTLNNLGYSLFLRGKHDIAVALLSEAARSDRTSQIVASNLAMSEVALTRAESKRTASAAAPVSSAARAPESSAPVETVLQLGSGVVAWKQPRIVRASAQVQELRVDPLPPATESESQPSETLERVPVAFTPYAAREMPSVATEAVSSYQLAALPTPPAQDLQVGTPAARPRPPGEITIVTRNTIPPAVGAIADQAKQTPAAPSPSHDSGQLKQASLLPGTIEVSNGAGRRKMAARMRDFLATVGFSVTRLTNADHFSHLKTVITYRPGYRDLAETLMNQLPNVVSIEAVQEQSTAVRIKLGGDLLDFDRRLLQAERPNSHDSSV